jgi:hypothetical protein
MVITETEESSSGSMEMRLSQCLEALESDNDNDNFDNMFIYILYYIIMFAYVAHVCPSYIINLEIL